MSLSRRSALTVGAGFSLAAAGSLAAFAPAPARASAHALQEAHAAAGRARAAYHLLLESGRLPALILDLAERIYERHRATEEALGDRLAGARPAGLDQPDVQAAIQGADTPTALIRLMRDIEARALAGYLAQETAEGEAKVLLAAAAADGAMHWALLNHTLGEALPRQGLSAGGSLPTSGIE